MKKNGKKIFLAVGVIVALAATIRTLTPFWNDHHEQDQCNFGRTSNSEYRKLLSEAARRLKANPETLSGAQLAVGERIRKLIEDLTSNDSDIELKVAGAHAVMRAAGAFFAQAAARTTGELAGSIHLEYQISSIKLGIFSPIDRYARIIIEMPFHASSGEVFRTDTLFQSQPYNFDVVVLYPNFIGRISNFGWLVNRKAEVVPGLQCPQMPPDSIAKSYKDWLSKTGM